jgi:hypothetical protein
LAAKLEIPPEEMEQGAVYFGLFFMRPVPGIIIPLLAGFVNWTVIARRRFLPTKQSPSCGLAIASLCSQWQT